ncbi:MAG TPA: YihY/virulence factor BrkB family protein [Acidimicrobiales bacterium]|nr:YihY/virulence factor BrkB family protein [Acidimicrobiales bacterium]
MASSERERKSPVGDLLGVVLAAVAMGAAGVKALRGPAPRAPEPVDLRGRDDSKADGVEVMETSAEARRARARAGVHDERKPPTPKKKGGIKAKLHEYGERWPVLGRALDVQERYSTIHGNNLAGSVTLQAFLSLFPIILLAVAVVGFFAKNADVAGSIIGSLGLNGDAARAVRDAVTASEHSRKAASVIGLAGLLWSGLGLVNALQYAYNQVWQVKERGIKDKAVGVAWLAGAALLFLAAAVVTTALNWLPGIFAPLGFAVALTVDIALWAWTAKLLPNRDVPWRAVLPGAVLGGVGLELLKAVGAFYVPRLVASSSQLYGSLGVVFAILAWLFFFGRLIVYSATLNVVLWERKTGTVEVVAEVPNVDGADPGDSATRLGRLERAPSSAF